MSVLEYLMQGFTVAIDPMNFIYCIVGCFLGTLVGVLPGLGPTAGMAMLIPLTIGMPPVTAIIMLAGIYYGSMYGGSTTAILINCPGEAASVPTALDGYPLTLQGRSGPALGMAAIASFIAGTFGVVMLTILGPVLSDVALKFGPPENCALMCLGLTIIVSLAGKSIIKGLISGLAGLFLSTIGIDPIWGVGRFAFTTRFLGGVDFISVVVGLFAIAEILGKSQDALIKLPPVPKGIKALLPNTKDFMDSRWTFVRSSVLGFFIGILPGASSSVASFMAYDLEKKVSRHPEKFGSGAIEGVAAAEGANNSAVAGGMVPLMTLGLPVSAPMAVLLGALMVHGLQPGPLLFTKDAAFSWGLIASMYMGNIILVILNLPLVPLWARLAQVPYHIMAPIILVLSLIGTYSVRSSMFDVWVALIFGLIGYGMNKHEYPTPPLVLGLILGPMLEATLRQSLTLSGGSLSIFFIRPISASLLVLAFVSLCVSIIGRVRNMQKGRSIWFSGEEVDTEDIK